MFSTFLGCRSSRVGNLETLVPAHVNGLRLDRINTAGPSFQSGFEAIQYGFFWMLGDKFHAGITLIPDFPADLKCKGGS